MLQVTNRQKRTCPFDEYLQLPGWSYSKIKNDGNEFAPTAKMRLGTRVHNYLFDPGAYDWEEFNLVRPLAVEVAKTIGKPLLQKAFCEVAWTADFNCEGFTMPWKGRTDICIPGVLVLDLKVSELNLDAAVKHFGYDYQLTGYALGAGCPVAMIIQVNPRTKKTNVKTISLAQGFWENETKKRGLVLC